jgi:hypothetical protein
MEDLPIHEIIVARLAPLLGPNTAGVALTTFCRRLARDPEALAPEDVPQLLAALRPMLRTLVGRVRAEALLEQLARELA